VRRLSAGREVVDVPTAFELRERVRECIVTLVVQVPPLAELLEPPVKPSQVDRFRPPTGLGQDSQHVCQPQPRLVGVGSG